MANPDTHPYVGASIVHQLPDDDAHRCVRPHVERFQALRRQEGKTVAVKLTEAQIQTVLGALSQHRAAIELCKDTPQSALTIPVAQYVARLERQQATIDDIVTTLTSGEPSV